GASICQGSSDSRREALPDATREPEVQAKQSKGSSLRGFLCRRCCLPALLRGQNLKSGILENRFTTLRSAVRPITNPGDSAAFFRALSAAARVESVRDCRPSKFRAPASRGIPQGACSGGSREEGDW